jgi:tetratricopeptide (TPR) repeat protein
MQEARKSFEREVAVRENRVAAHPDESIRHFELAGAYRHLGLVYAETEQPEEALRLYQLAQTILEGPNLRDSKEIPYLREKSALYNNLGNLPNLHGIDSLQLHQRALTIRLELVRQHPLNPDYRHSLARTYGNMGHIFEAIGKREEARKSYEQAGTELGKLIKSDPREPAYRRDLAINYNGFGWLITKTDPNGALKYYDQAQAIYKKLIDDFPDVPSYRQELAAVFQNRAVAQLKRGDRNAAIAAYEEARLLWKKLAEEDPRNRERQEDLDYVEKKLAELRQGR